MCYEPTLYLVNTSFVKPYLEAQDNRDNLMIPDRFGQLEYASLVFTVGLLPQVDYVVLMISSVEVDVTWVDEEE